ncbi:MAG: VWA domain-containing protein [Ruminococcaceae bacterium]|nr:VWA domain-containing protein [Oscillospiraceae bacterium]
MTKRSYNLPMRIIAMVLSLVLVVSLLPAVALFTVTAAGADVSGIVSSTADANTMDSWRDAFDPNDISTEHVGGVWTDKSVVTAGNVTTAFPGISGLTAQENNFLVTLSALAANSVMVGKGSAPTDTMFVLDISGSMSTSELRAMVNATNEAIHKLLDGTGNTNRIGIVLYSSDAHLLLPLDHYTPVVDGGVTEYIELTDNYIRTARAEVVVEGSGSASTRPDWWPDWLPWEDNQGGQTQTETVYLKNSAGENVNTRVELEGGTYIQGGLWAAWEAFDAATVSDSRSPIVVLMSDGAPTYTTNNFNNVPDSPNYGAGNSSTAADGFVTQLTAAFVKEKLAAKYNSAAYFYTLGLGVDNVTNSEIAKAVLDPTGSAHSDITALWTRYNALTAGGTMTVDLGDSRNDPSITYDATVKGKGAYVDRYFSAGQASDLSTAFQSIVNEISLKAGYVVTRLNGENANMGGYVTFVDEIGPGMQIKEIEGILIGQQLYTGRVLAHALNTGVFGTKDEPTALGDNMVWALQKRLNLTDKQTAWDLLDKAYNAGQLSYNETTGAFSNYIGWFGDANGKFLAFWDAENPDAEIPAGAAYANKCYGMLGSTTSEQTNHASDMMYVTIQVSKPVTTAANGALEILEKSPEMVTFRVPASLLPTVTYQIELDADSVEHATSATVTYDGAEPIRLIYEVGLHSALTPLNIKDFLREGYQAMDAATGNYYLYTNAWHWDGADDPGSDWQDPNNHPTMDNDVGKEVLPDTGKNSITYAYFEPGEDNEHYYFTEDKQIYVKDGENYTAITQVPASATGTTYYYQHITYTNNGTGIDRHFGQLSEKAVQAAIDAGSVKVPAGTMHFYNITHDHDKDKTTNTTGSYFAVSHHLVDAAINSSNLQEHSYELVYMGNNGRITYAPAQGIQLSKTMNDNTLPDATFTFDVALTAPAGTTLAGAYQTLHVDAQGNEIVGNAAVSGGKITVSLKPGESIYILDLPTGTTYQITERKAAGYLESTSAGASGTVANNTIKAASFVNKVRGTGSLSIVKAVTYQNGAVKNEASANKKFPVTVTLTDGLDAYVGKVTVDGQEKDVVAGQLSFDIVDGQTVLITNIPEGVTYTVAEGALPEGYTFNATASVGLSGEITTAGAAALLANTYTPDAVEINNTKPAITVAVDKTLITTQTGIDFTFTFKLQQFDALNNKWVDVSLGGTPVITQINMTAAGTKEASLSLAGLTFDKVGEYDFRVVEDIPTQNPVAGMTYDRTFHDFEVIVADKDLDGNLEIANVRAVQHAVVNWDAANELAEVTTDFVNTYEVGSTKLTIQANKLLKDLTVAAGNPAKDKALKDGQFTFELYKTDSTFATQGITPVEAKNGFRGDVIFPAQTYTQADTYYYVIREVDEGKPGYTYDGAVYKVTVKVEPVSGNLQVTQATVQKNDETAVDVTANISDNILNGDSITFENTYKAELASATFGGKKTLNGWNIEDDMFTFVLKNAAGNEIERVENVGNSFTFTKIDYVVETTSTYTISELRESKNGYTYDETVYYVTVEVTDNGAGKLEAKVTYTKNGIPVASPDFVNSYKAEETAPVVLGGFKELLVDTTLFTRVLKDGDFSFVLKDEAGNEVETVKNVGNAFTFTGLTFDKADTYKYTISEVKGSRGGIAYDDTVYNVTVTVSDLGSGKLTAAVAYATENASVDPDDVVFTNRYTASEAKLVLAGRKVMVGRDLEAGEFEFVLKDSQGVEIDRKSNDAHGNVTFDELKYQGVGVHTYTISEVKGSKGGVTYDETEYAVTVTVQDNGEGQLVAVVEIPDKGDIVADFQFFNRYKADSVTVNITGENDRDGEKTLEDQSSLTDKTLNDFEFRFVLMDSEGNVIETVSDNGTGFNFADITYAEVGKHVYYLSELPNGIAGMTYDYSKYRITVEITDDVKDGQLEAKVTYEKAESVESDTYVPVTAVSFHNVYKAKETSVSFSGVKVLNGGLDLKDGDFTFILKDAGGMELQTVKNDESGRFAFQSIEFTTEGTYVYTLEEKDDGKDLITYDTTKYTLTVTVVDENGELKATTVVTKGNETVTDYGFTNIYTPEDAETIISVQKILDNKSEETMGLNGFIFQLVEEASQEALTATSDAEGKAQFQLGFSAADVGKTFTYKLSEKAGDVEGMTYDDTVYEIKVVVSQNSETGELVLTVTRDNEAVDGSAEFTNVYAPVSEPEEDPNEPGKDPEDPDGPPETGDDFHMILWGTVCLGAAVMLAVLVIGKKQFTK